MKTLEEIIKAWNDAGLKVPTEKELLDAYRKTPRAIMSKKNAERLSRLHQEHLDRLLSRLAGNDR